MDHASVWTRESFASPSESAVQRGCSVCPPPPRALRRFGGRNRRRPGDGASQCVSLGNQSAPPLYLPPILPCSRPPFSRPLPLLPTAHPPSAPPARLLCSSNDPMMETPVQTENERVRFCATHALGVQGHKCSRQVLSRFLVRGTSNHGRD